MRLPSDKKFRDTVKSILGVVGFYAPLLYLFAPVSKVAFGTLAVLACAAVFLFLRFRVPFYLSTIPAALVTLAVQMIELRLTDAPTYFVGCDAMTVDCLTTHEAEVMDRQVVIWPYHGADSWFGSFKRFWLKAVLGSDGFDDRHLERIASGGRIVIASPLERQLFQFFGGSDAKDGLAIAYRLPFESRDVTLDSNITMSPGEGGSLGFSAGASLGRRWFEIVQVGRPAGALELAFSAQGGKQDPALWRRAIRNDFWLEALPKTNTLELNRRVQANRDPLLRGEALVADALEAASWCQALEDNTAAKIGCRARLSHLQQRLADLAGSPDEPTEGAQNFVRALFRLIEDGSVIDRSPTVPAIEPLYIGFNQALAELELAVSDRFVPAEAIDQESPEETECRAERSAEMEGESLRQTFEDLAAFFADLDSCTPKERHRVYDAVVDAGPDELPDLLNELETTGGELERRRYAFDLLAHVDSRIADPEDSYWMTHFSRIFSLYSSRGYISLRDDEVLDALNSVRENTTLQLKRLAVRDVILADFENAPRRVQELVAGDPTIFSRIQTRAEHVLKVSNWLAARMEVHRSAPVEAKDAISDALQFVESQDWSTVLDEVTDLSRTFIDASEMALALPDGTSRFPKCFDDLRTYHADADIGDLRQFVTESDTVGLLATLSAELPNCRLHDALAFMTRTLDADELSTESGWRENLLDFDKEFPGVRRAFMPRIAEMEGTSHPTDIQQNYTLNVARRLGAASVAYSDVDWSKLPSKDEIGRGYAFIRDSVSSENVAASRETYCGIWDTPDRLRPVLLRKDSQWKQSGLLIPLALMEDVCAPSERSVARAASNELFGDEVLSAYKSHLLPSDRIYILEDASGSELLNALAENGLMPRDASTLATLVLFDKDAELRGLPKDDAEDEDNLDPLLTTTFALWFLAGSPEEELVEVPSVYSAAFRRVAAHPDSAVRTALVAALVDPEFDTSDLGPAAISSGSDPEDESKTRALLLDLSRVFRHLSTEQAQYLMIPLLRADPTAAELIHWVDLGIDAEEFTKVAFGIDNLPEDQRTPELKSGWCAAMVEKYRDDTAERPEEQGRALVYSLTSLGC